MNCLSKSQTAEAKTAPAPSAEERYQQSCDELRTARTELKAAEKTLRDYLGKYFGGKDPRVALVNGNWLARVGAMRLYPELQAIEKQWAQVFQKQQTAIRECARLKKETGL